ncbi:MAG: LPS export ABC transporter periplasmic protein LptC, partial [bacterium]|nr:LPS export ABC transporter periplasmic protein LptC [bacterium]
APAASASGNGEGTSILGSGDVTFRTPGRFILNNKSGDFTVPQDFTISRPGSDARADRATGNFKKKSAVLVGNVVLHQTQPITNKGQSVQQATQKPMTITCKELTVDWGNKTYTAVGSVHVVQGTDTVDADRAVLDEVTDQLTLQGNVRMHQSVGRSADAPQVDYNTKSRQFDANGGVTTIFPAPTPSPGPAATPAPKPKRRGLHL